MLGEDGEKRQARSCWCLAWALQDRVVAKVSLCRLDVLTPGVQEMMRAGLQKELRNVETQET